MCERFVGQNCKNKKTSFFSKNQFLIFLSFYFCGKNNKSFFVRQSQSLRLGLTAIIITFLHPTFNINKKIIIITSYLISIRDSLPGLSFGRRPLTAWK
jgi:hypothetical protein